MHTGPFMTQSTGTCFEYLNTTCDVCSGFGGYWCSNRTTTTPNCVTDIIPAHIDPETGLFIPQFTVQNTKYTLTRADGGTACNQRCSNQGIGNGAPGYEATNNGADRDVGMNVDQKKCE